MADFEPISYRIRIGVTGHRKLDDPEAVGQLVKKALDAEIRTLFRKDSQERIDRIRREGTTAISYRVVTALAEGSDRVVAQAVLDYPGARLDAVLPLAIEDYLEDFADDSSKQEFRRLLGFSRRPVQLRTRPIRDERHDAADQAELRREAYRAAGQYVADHCDVLIAVWDGEQARGRGGTAEIVQYALEQGRPVIRVWKGAYDVLNREGGNGLDAQALEGIDRFNRLPITPGQRMGYAQNLDRDLFEKPKTAASISIATRELVNRCLFPYYAQASIVSKQSRDTFHRAGRNIYVLSAAAVGCAATGVLIPSLAAAGFGMELVFLIVILITLSQAHRRHAHQGWIENRFLTERIRCGIFMAICGIEPRPIQVLPYMGHSQTVNDWMVRVFDEIWDRLPALDSGSRGDYLSKNAYVRDVWIGEQVEFHKDKEVREGRMRRRLSLASAIVLPVTVGAAALHLLLLTWEPSDAAGQAVQLLHHGLHQGLAFVGLLFPAIAASLAGMEAHREHLRLEKRSANMVPQLTRLKRQMASADDYKSLQSLLQQLDEIMLRETQDWLMLMRYVEIKAT